MIKSVVFDAYGTLFDVYSVLKKCEEVYPERGLQISQIWRQKQLEYSWLRTLMKEYVDFWQITKDALYYALEELKLQYDERKIEELMNAYLHLDLFSDTIEALKTFKPCELVILTNGNIKMFDNLSLNTGLSKYIDKILSADSVKLYKPRSSVYELAINHLGVSKTEILFISSNAWDIAGAKSFGFTAGWINRLNKPFEKLGYKPDYVASNLSELSMLIRDMEYTEFDRHIENTYNKN